MKFVIILMLASCILSHELNASGSAAAPSSPLAIPVTEVPKDLNDAFAGFSDFLKQTRKQKKEDMYRHYAYKMLAFVRNAKIKRQATEIAQLKAAAMHMPPLNVAAASAVGAQSQVNAKAESELEKLRRENRILKEEVAAQKSTIRSLHQDADRLRRLKAVAPAKGQAPVPATKPQANQFAHVQLPDEE